MLSCVASCLCFMKFFLVVFFVLVCFFFASGGVWFVVVQCVVFKDEDVVIDVRTRTCVCVAMFRRGMM